MPKSIDILKECAEEIADAYKIYELVSQDLGMKFLEAVERNLEMLISNPEIGAVSHRGIRKIVLTRFPYVLYYIERPLTTQLIGFMHAKRNPRSIKSVISEREHTSRT